MNATVHLNLGCGNSIKDGWLNVDAFCPLADEQWPVAELDRRIRESSVDSVYAGHLLEHLSVAEISDLIYRVWSVLKVDGTFQIVVPNFLSLIREVDLQVAAGDPSHVDLLSFWIFSTANETPHKTVWTSAIGRYLITREGLFTITVQREDQRELWFTCKPIKKVEKC